MDKEISSTEGDCANNLKSTIEEALQNKSFDRLPFIDTTSPNVDRSQLRSVLEAQQEMVCQKMHEAMSPISAVSGYLELMKMMLEQQEDNESLLRYRNKVEQAISEIGEIVEDVHATFDDADTEGADNINQVRGETISSTAERRVS